MYQNDKKWNTKEENVTICNIYNIKIVETNYKKFEKNMNYKPFLLTN